MRDILDEKQRLDDTGANAQSPMSKAASPKEKGVILGRRRASATLPLEVGKPFPQEHVSPCTVAEVVDVPVLTQASEAEAQEVAERPVELDAPAFNAMP